MAYIPCCAFVLMKHNFKLNIIMKKTIMITGVIYLVIVLVILITELA